MNRTFTVTEFLAIISASLSIVIACITIWKANSSIIKRLAIIQNKLSSLRSLVAIERARINDIEKFLAASQNYSIREFPGSVEREITEDYKSEDTGF